MEEAIITMSLDRAPVPHSFRETGIIRLFQKTINSTRKKMFPSIKSFNEQQTFTILAEPTA